MGLIVPVMVATARHKNESDFALSIRSGECRTPFLIQFCLLRLAQWAGDPDWTGATGKEETGLARPLRTHAK